VSLASATALLRPEIARSDHGIDQQGCGANLALIDEFVAQSTAGDATCIKYRTHLLEFARWCEHTGCMDLLDVRTGQVARFMAYLRSGNRFAAAKHHRVAQSASGATRKNVRSSLCRFYR
jgi:site-specific recombinase XerD